MSIPFCHSRPHSGSENKVYSVHEEALPCGRAFLIVPLQLSALPIQVLTVQPPSQLANSKPKSGIFIMHLLHFRLEKLIAFCLLVTISSRWCFTVNASFNSSNLRWRDSFRRRFISFKSFNCCSWSIDFTNHWCHLLERYLPVSLLWVGSHSSREMKSL